MKATRNTQEKLHEILRSQGYTIRYEKGNFNGGYCVVHNQQVIIINKFHPLEGKINSLVEIIKDLEFNEEELNPSQSKIVKQIKEASS